MNFTWIINELFESEKMAPWYTESWCILSCQVEHKKKKGLTLDLLAWNILQLTTLKRTVFVICWCIFDSIADNYQILLFKKKFDFIDTIINNQQFQQIKMQRQPQAMLC